ncbi:MAG TPA: N-acetyl-1-D-myo-inositol-2-amino-2-deoxy-alpha-D-glucopyranoside deacetylase [Nakamurella sp.]|nr:N-acetyl-1-D-myo-inositol-2-amino-2-deoxy-alpha-D-glucopyranoside deacetylase [Nakamurella sp.]
MLAVHAHPDDESITMGGTLARYAALGMPVTLVTATLGEEGEAMHDVLAGLTAGAADQLGGYRLAELGAACRALGVTDRRMLGGLGRFRDSGMAGSESARHPRAFCRAGSGGPDHDEAVAALTEVIGRLRPRVVLTYDADGGYGHPDHVAAHQVAVAAVRAAGTGGADGSGEIRLLAVVRPRSVFTAALAEMWAGPLPAGYARGEPDDFGFLVDDGSVDVAVPVAPWRAARRAALSAHASQLDVWAGRTDGFALTNLLAQPLLDHEYYRVLAGPAAPIGATDLFAGL